MNYGHAARAAVWALKTRPPRLFNDGVAVARNSTFCAW